jgi:hypothetical protein
LFDSAVIRGYKTIPKNHDSVGLAFHRTITKEFPPRLESKMKRKDLARELARGAHISAGAAQDRVDALVHEILRKLRAGEPVDIVRLGKLATRASGK